MAYYDLTVLGVNYGFVKSRLWKSKSKSGTQLLLDFCQKVDFKVDFKSGKSDFDSTPPRRSLFHTLFSTATQLTFTYLYSPSEARLGDRDYTTVTLLFWTEYCKFECNNCEENEEVSIFYFIPAPNMKSEMNEKKRKSTKKRKYC